MSDDDIPLVQRFVLRDEAHSYQLWALLKRWKELIERGKFFQVVVSVWAEDRSIGQHRRMWKALIEPIAEQAKMNGYRVMPNDWHLVLKIMFLPEVCAKGVHKWTYDKSGDRKLTMSTGDLNFDEHNLYTQRIAGYAIELGVQLPANPRDL